ncbi:MAG: TonB-dependent receptor, partial [Halioglobus sp.]
SRGVEIESMYSLSENWLLGANGAYLDATYNDFESGCPANQNEWNAQCVSDSGFIQDLSGERLPLAPEWSTTIFAEFTGSLADKLVMKARADAVYQDDIKFEPTPDSYLTQDAFWTYNLRVALEPKDESWTLALAGMNLSNKRTSNFGGPSLGLPGTYFANTSQPLRIQLSAVYRFL